MQPQTWPQEAPVRTSKKCRICRTKKPHDEFPRNAKATDGRRSECQPCRTVLDKKRREDWVALPVGPLTKVYGPRDCNRCDREYTGKGRALCDTCIDYANGQADAAAGFSFDGRVPRRASA